MWRESAGFRTLTHCQRYSTRADNENESSHSAPNAGQGSALQFCRSTETRIASVFAPVVMSIEKSRQPATSDRNGADCPNNVCAESEASLTFTTGTPAETMSRPIAPKLR